MPVPRSEPSRRRPPGARRAAILALLDEHEGEGLAVSDLAPMTGLHPNTVRAHLEVLVRTGSVTRRTQARNVPGRPRELYQATGAAQGDRNYQLLARMLAGRLAELTDDPVAEAVEAGRRWSRQGPEATVPAQGPEATRPAQSAATDESAADEASAPVGTGDRAATTEPSASGPRAAAAPGTREALAPVIRMLRDSGFAPELSPDAATIELRHCPFRELAAEQPDIVCSAHLGLIQGALERLGGDVAATRILPFIQPDLCRAELHYSHPPSAG